MIPSVKGVGIILTQKIMKRKNITISVGVSEIFNYLYFSNFIKQLIFST